jgi:signal transduction histidine kinase
MNAWFFRRRTGREATLWPVLLLLVLVVLTPTAVLTWLVGRAVQNERLVVRQRLAETHQAALRQMQREIESDFADLLERCDRAAAETGAELLAAEMIERRMADAVVCFDAQGGMTYPAPLAAFAPEPLEESAPWREAAMLEFQRQDPRRAAERYAAIAAVSEHPAVKARAWQAQARCLDKAGDAPAATGVFRQILESHALHDVRDSQNRLIAADAGLRSLELMVENGHRSDETAAVRQQVRELISPERSSEVPSSQRRFIARRLGELFPGEVAFPWLAAEELGAQYAAAQGMLPPPGTLHPTMMNDVWQIVSPQRRVVLLWRRATLADRIAATVHVADAAPLRTVVLAPEAPDAAEDHLAMTHLPTLPGWRLALAVHGASPLEAEAGRQIALYVWTAALAMGAAAAGAALLARSLGRQHRLARLQNDWLATVSHELKTPLSSIQLLTDSLLEEDDVDRAAYLRLISGETERLTRLIERLLMLTRHERGPAVLERRPIQAGELVASACAAMGERLHGPDCEYHQHLEPHLPPLHADRDAMVVVLVNLLENAWKFTGPKKRIGLTVERDEDGVCFRVRDNGIGVSPRDMQRVFERFYQADRRLSRERGGCGLGLSIVKQLVEAHGGRVAVESRPGDGSTFTVRLPAAAVGQAPPDNVGQAPPDNVGQAPPDNGAAFCVSRQWRCRVSGRA